MRIGLDLDQTVYGFPGFFRAFIPAMHAAGHELFVVSSHGRESHWPADRERLRGLGMDPDLLDPSLLAPRGMVKGAIPQMKAAIEL